VIGVSESKQKTMPSIKPVRLWRYSKRVLLALTDTEDLYRITGRKTYKIEKFEEPLDKGWSAARKLPLDQYALVEFLNSFDTFEDLKTLLNFLKEGYEYETQPFKAELSPYISKKLEEIGKTLGITPQEALKQMMKDNLKTMREAEDRWKATEERHKKEHAH
jgi:hypothetical protein